VLGRLVIAIAGSALLAGCHPAPEQTMTEEEKAQVAEAVEARVSGYVDASTSGRTRTASSWLATDS
jgi:ABC-type uncharacterized transport system auxiliary subunit